MKQPMNPCTFTAGMVRRLLIDKKAKNTSDKEIDRCLTIKPLQLFAKQLRDIDMLRVDL